MKIAETCVKHPVFTVMLIAFLLTLGVFSYRGLAVDLFPKADPATVNVDVQLPGATPEEMVTGIVLPLEDAISSVNGIDEMSVYASQGLADITCTFVLERDIDGAAQDIREKVAAAVNRLPRETLPPVITKEDPQSDPIMTLLVSGPMSRRELTEIADKQVRRAIQTVNGVGSVELNGGQARQIRVLLDAQKLTSHNFTVLDVRNALQRENIEAPGGRMITGPQELGLRTLGRVTSADQFSQIVVGTHGGIPVRVHDVAQVEDGAQELRTWSAFFNKRNPREDVVSIQILRQSGANTVRVADNVRDQIELLRSQMPPGVQLLIVHDISDFVKASVHSLIEHLILGSTFASAIVWLFIRNWRAVLIAAVAIPSSIIATFTLMRGMDFSLNNLTLLALTLAVGIVIDDAIIVLENIVRFMEDKGRNRVDAAIEATQEIGLAVMATTLSLIIIFLPIAFMTGYARKYVNSFGWTMAMAVVVSLLVAFTLTPMMSSRLLKVNEKSNKSHSHGFLHTVEETYMRMLRWSLAHRGGLVVICLRPSFLIRLVPSGGSRLDSSRRRVGAAEFLHSSRGHLAAEDKRDGIRYGPAYFGLSGSGVCAVLHPRANQSRASLYWTCPAQPAEVEPFADGDKAAANSRDLPQRHLQRPSALGPGRRDLFPDLRGHPRHGSQSARRNQQTSRRPDEKLSGPGRRQPQPEPQHARTAGQGRSAARRRYWRSDDGYQRRCSVVLLWRG
jgi:hydrophobic/amphiphilic exporter-1 (mainly G- bacteria), HAE1 family